MSSAKCCWRTRERYLELLTHRLGAVWLRLPIHPWNDGNDWHSVRWETVLLFIRSKRVVTDCRLLFEAVIAWLKPNTDEQLREGNAEHLRPSCLWLSVNRLKETALVKQSIKGDRTTALSSITRLLLFTVSKGHYTQDLRYSYAERSISVSQITAANMVLDYRASHESLRDILLLLDLLFIIRYSWAKRVRAKHVI